MQSIEYNIYIILSYLGEVLKGLFVFCIIIYRKIGKILFIEKLDVIKKIFWVLNSNILIVIIILIVKLFITYKA